MEHHNNVIIGTLGGIIGALGQICGITPDTIHLKLHAMSVLMAEPIVWPLVKVIVAGFGTAIISKLSADGYDMGKTYIKKRYCNKD